MMVGRALNRIGQETGNLEIENIDIILNPRRALQDGITMIPALQMGEQRLSGIFLSEEKIRDFLDSLG